jgi:hypothetical protein
MLAAPAPNRDLGERLTVRQSIGPRARVRNHPRVGLSSPPVTTVDANHRMISSPVAVARRVLPAGAVEQRPVSQVPGAATNQGWLERPTPTTVVMPCGPKVPGSTDTPARFVPVRSGTDDTRVADPGAKSDGAACTRPVLLSGVPGCDLWPPPGTQFVPTYMASEVSLGPRGRVPPWTDLDPPLIEIDTLGE